MTLKKATMNDWEILLEWRNDMETRKNSHHMNAVAKQDHLKWLSSVIEDANRDLYIWLENNVPAGTVRADWDKKANAYALSWTISPDFRGQGIGKKMVKHLAQQMNQKLRAEVKTGNNASVKIALSAGLTFQYEEDGTLHYANYTESQRASN